MKLSLRENQELVHSDEITWIEKSNGNKLCVYSFQTRTLTRKYLYFPEIIQPFPCVCILPNRRTFVYGNIIFDIDQNKAAGITFFIDPDGTTEIVKPYGEPYHFAISTFYNNMIYLFGRFDSNGKATNIAQRFNLKTKSWCKFRTLKVDTKFESGIEFMGCILITTIYSLSYVYDLYSDYYNHLSIKGLEQFNKLVCKTDGVCYIIESKGWIYESEYRCIWNWKRIMENKDFSLKILINTTIFHENNIKFLGYKKGCIVTYEFDLKKK